MSTCQTCCYWKRNPPLDEWDDAAPSPLFGDCGCPRVVYGDTRQNVIYYAPKQVNEDYTYASRPRSELPDSGNADMLLYQDYSSYAAALTTGQDFGCVHWQAEDN